jgi:hypothetical protein
MAPVYINNSGSEIYCNITRFFSEIIKIVRNKINKYLKVRIKYSFGKSLIAGGILGNKNERKDAVLVSRRDSNYARVRTRLGKLLGL